jgi:hypothetical protein
MSKLVDIARKDVGKKEKPGNSGFVDANMQKRLEAVGWQVGWSWCATMIEAWVWDAFPERKDKVKGLFVPSAVNTFRNLERAGYKASMVPTVGAIVAWQRMKEGKPQWTGHIGVVSQVISDTEFWSIEGNASNTGSANGDGVYEVHRHVKSVVANGLKVIGFIQI